MSIHIYHPNKRSTGFATSFWYSDRDDSFFATLLKQSGWDEARQNGVFKDSKNDPLKKVNIKLSPTEIAGILDCIERNRPFSGFHDADESPKQIKFEPWITDGNTKGYSFSVTVKSKSDSAFSNPFYIGLTFAEARLVREFLIYSLHRHFSRRSPASEKETQQPPMPSDIVSPDVAGEAEEKKVIDPLLDF
jgi:hypothetical protein